MSSNARSIVFAFALCLLCSVLLTAASTGLQPFQEKNMELDRHRNILQAAGLTEEGRSYDATTIEALYSRYIQPGWVGEDGSLRTGAEHQAGDLPIYLFERDQSIQAYVIPINSRGLWGKIYGYLAIADDGSTIRGFTVYKHSETPGLGGEIEKKWFQDNFKGKKIVNREGRFVSISIAKGSAEQVPEPRRAHYVDGISGATLTGRYLTSGLEHTLQQYEPVSIRFRKNRIGDRPARNN